MKLVHESLEENFCIEPNIVNVFVIEPEDKFFFYCSEFAAQIDGADGSFCLSEKDKMLTISKVVALVDVFDLKSNDKKLITKLYNYLHSLLSEKLYIEAMELGKRWAELFSNLNAECNCPIEYDEDDFSLALLKAFNVKFSEEDNSLLEKLISYIHILAEFAAVKIFVFVNLKTMLTESELSALYKEAALCQVNLFLLENTLKPVLDGENVILIDRDLCEIIVKSNEL